MVIDHNSVLCLKHFAPVDVIIFNNCDGERNGFKNVTKSALPLVKEGAVPLFFPEEEEVKTSELKVSTVRENLEKTNSV